MDNELEQQATDLRIAALRISERDRLLGRAELVLRLLKPYIPQGSGSLLHTNFSEAIEALERDIKDLFNPE